MPQESHFVQHEPCPRCHSRDNLGVYSDHSYCFGCGLVLRNHRSMSVEDIRKQIRYDEDKEGKRKRVPYLPEDYTTAMPDLGVSWLGKYGVTEAERKKYRIGWTENADVVRRALVYPAYDLYGNLLMVQLRGMERKEFYTRGNPESVYWTASANPDGSNCVVCVEDFVSAIRVGRLVEAMPLWGSSLSLNQIRRLSDHYEHLVLWLDFDKAGASQKLKYKAMPYFKSVRSVVTQLDPKELTDEQLAENLGTV